MTGPRILESNQFWVFVEKPEGWLSVPSRLGTQDLRPCLGVWLQQHLKVAVFPVHRLDFEVSGLMIYALEKNFHRFANGLFENHQIEKTYQALTLTSGALPIGIEQSWKSRIVRGKKRSFHADHGQVALTFATPVEVQEDKALWTLRPLTGRPHQLRLELSSRGFPILGDQLYGSSDEWRINGIALRAISLDFSKVSEREAWALPEVFNVPGL